MKKKIAFGIAAGMILFSALTGCGQTANRPPQNSKNEPAVTDNKVVLKDIDLPAKGVVLTGYHQDLHLSPDGKTAAFSGYNYKTPNNTVEYKMVLANLATGEVKTFDSATRVLGWLPDGSRLLYHYEGSLRIFDPGSGNYREIARDAWHASISPDGRQVAYAPRGKGLFVYDLNSSQTRQLTKDKYDHHPVWYPDGKQLFYFTDLGKPLGDDAGNLEGMARVSLETGQVDRIGKEEGKFRQAHWLVPGKSLHIVKGWDDGFYLGILDLEKNKYFDLGENPGGYTYFTQADPKNGRLIVSASGKVDIYNGQGTKTASYSLPESGQQNFNYAVSPGGDKLAFAQGDFGRYMDSKIKGNKVKVSDYDGQNVRELTSDYKYNDAIIWSKDGNYVVSLQMDLEKITALKVLPVVNK